MLTGDNRENGEIPVKQTFSIWGLPAVSFRADEFLQWDVWDVLIGTSSALKLHPPSFLSNTPLATQKNPRNSEPTDRESWYVGMFTWNWCVILITHLSPTHCLREFVLSRNHPGVPTKEDPWTWVGSGSCRLGYPTTTSQGHESSMLLGLGVFGKPKWWTQKNA